MVQHVKLNALHECNDRAVRLCCENGNHTIGKAEAKNDCQCSDQPDGQPHVGREPERKQRTRTTMPLTGRDLLDPMRLHGKHLLTILASHFHRVLNRTDLAHRYLLCCQDRHFPLHQIGQGAFTSVIYIELYVNRLTFLKRRPVGRVPPDLLRLKVLPAVSSLMLLADTRPPLPPVSFSPRLPFRTSAQ